MRSGFAANNKAAESAVLLFEYLEPRYQAGGWNRRMSVSVDFESGIFEAGIL
jgi:hypothetical protein